MDGSVRILHAVVNMNRGGAETLLMNLYRNIDRTRIQFDFLTCKPGVFDQEIKKLGGRVHRIPYVTESSHYTYIQALQRFFQSHPEYKVVHSHMDKMSGFVLRAAKQAGIPSRIAHSHNTSSEGSWIAKLYKEYAGYHLLQNATHYVACSQKAANWLFKKQATDSILLKNAIESTKFKFSTDKRNKIRNELNISEDCFVLGHIGRFNLQKNHSFLIDIVNQVVQSHQKVLLLLAGDGEQRHIIQQKVNSLGIQQHVRFLGIREDVHHLLQAFDVFVFPSHHEGLPVTLIEAQGAGLPCLISEHITREVDMGLGAVRYLPITTTTPWINELTTLRSQQKRYENSDQVLRENGYDISSSAKMAETLYGKLVGI
jgi:glycosyltransferase involved in cell wall biosynthesis